MNRRELEKGDRERMKALLSREWIVSQFKDTTKGACFIDWVILANRLAFDVKAPTATSFRGMKKALCVHLAALESEGLIGTPEVGWYLRADHMQEYRVEEKARRERVPEPSDSLAML